MIDFVLGVNVSPKKKIGKTVQNTETFSCLLKEDTSVLDPVLILESEANLSGYNYMYCETFGRYYFINNIESVGNNLWRITGHVDVLNTYASLILNNDAVIKRQQNKFNLYLDDPDFHTYNYERIQTLKFPENDFSKTLQYVLVTNGEGGSSESKEGVENGDSI